MEQGVIADIGDTECHFPQLSQFYLTDGSLLTVMEGYLLLRVSSALLYGKLLLSRDAAAITYG